jgi:DNA-nicking Smr family endonuclease
MGKRGGRDDEDEALWARVVETAAPLRRRTKAAGSAKAVLPPPKPAKPAAKQKASRQPPGFKPEPPSKPRPVPQTGPLDRQTSRDLEKGRLEVEAKLDLHGMRQRDAHGQLRRFLKTAQARGLKHVLVITGKGADPETRRSFYEEEERGVLRNAVPRWLAEPDFAPLVVSYSPAPRRLGGDGALYVRLRKLRLR